MPVPTPHFLDHRTHRSRGSDSAASAPPVPVHTTTTASLPTSTGTTLVDIESDGIEQRSPADQLQALNNQLQLENRIKEGAENLLQMQLDAGLKSQVEEELELAQSKIDSIMKKIENYNTRTGRRVAHATENTRRKFNGAPLNALKPRDAVDEREDFRTALQEAMGYLRALHKLAGPNPLSPPTSPSSSNLAVPNESELNKLRVETMNSLIKVLQRNLRVRYDLSVPDVVQAVIPALADRATKQSRATAYRLVRHMLVSMQSVEKLKEHALDWYLVKSLSRDNKYTVEKEQAIKLIRAIVEIGSSRHGPGSAVGTGSVPLSEPVMRAFIAVAEQPEDPFKPICVQTLVEILLIDVQIMARTGGIHLLLHAINEGPAEMAPLISSAFLFIADSPRTRAYLHLGTDLEMAMAGVTDAYGKGADHADKMRGTAKLIVSMLRTWSGLMYFCAHDKLALRTLVDNLRIPTLTARDIILDMFFELFNIKPPEWHQAFLDGRRLTMYRRNRTKDTDRTAEVPLNKQDSLKLADQFVALLILVFSGAGLMDALTSMLEEELPDEAPTGSNMHRKATLLMAEILQTANRVLPLSVAAKIQALPRVFNLASDYREIEHRIVGTSTLSAIDTYNRHRLRQQLTAPKDVARPRANSVEDAVRRGQRQAEQTRIKLGMQMDDKNFQALLLVSQVLATKDQTKWNFDILQDLVEGPLLNPKRMEETIKVSRYMRKLISFFHPFAHRFSDLSKSKSNMRWVKLGCTLMNTLLSSPEGIRFLGEDDFMSQIVKSFAQLDPLNATQTEDPIFSKKRMQETLTYGYFEMLGVMSRRKEGIELLEKAKLFTAFYHLSELRSREDLIKAIIENLDYSIDGHSRIVLSKTLTSSYRDIRLYATNHLGELIRGSAQANAWTLRLLLTQLYDPDLDIQEVAVRYLEEACESNDVLEMVVEMNPTLDHLGEIGNGLLLKFMSTPMGFRYLYAAEYIDREMDAWFHERNLHYVFHIEVFTAKAFGTAPVDLEDEPLLTEHIVPPHFYGVMAKTELGCRVLTEKGHFGEFSQFIRKHGSETEDQEIILKLKSALWAVGNIGSTERGLPFLEEEEIIPTILDISEQNAICSVRGTCFFVLGLISSTPQGAEILDDYNWEATLSPLGLPTGLCVPTDIEKFVSLPSWNTTCDIDDGSNRLEPPASEEEIEVMTAIYNLANTVIANAASRTLTKMKSRREYRRIFASTTMLYRALHVISSQRYRLPVRRYIIDLFNVELNDEVVKKLGEHAIRLKLHSSTSSVVRGRMRAMSILGRPARHHHVSESDEESVSDEEEVPEVKKHPVVNLPPQIRIAGFD
ncbi:Rapamycin-insensitive companion of mTOR, N-term-domain-containing protein [Irpex rosettiformis]|uniref:Rapamycin-insensitive companion of mTOR, N-term-domain-containing protein n=1 Tax=Irpex rosettiformis TaxID=378272 RepID=A0ACB8U0H0_9APHY|nr:Rapamycin-insensitive companion of mTOR, N-term-domain-containing protein [Irpex rosettiformis]